MRESSAVTIGAVGLGLLLLWLVIKGLPSVQIPVPPGVSAS